MPSTDLMFPKMKVFLFVMCITDTFTVFAGFSEDVHKRFGDSLIIPLYNHTQVEIVFSTSQSVTRGAVCTVDGELVNCSSCFQHRMTVQDDFVNVGELTPADAGIYTVSDPYGNNIVTVVLNVEVYQHEYTEYAGSNVQISIPCKETSVVLFRPTIFGNPFQLCRVQNGLGRCHAPFWDSVSVENYTLQMKDVTSQHHGIYELVHEDSKITLCNISVHIKGHKETIALEPGAILPINFYTHTAVVVRFIPESNQNSSRVVLNATVVNDKNVELRSAYLIIRRVTYADQGDYQVYDLSEQHLYNEVKVAVRESQNIREPMWQGLEDTKNKTPESQRALQLTLGLLVILSVAIFLAIGLYTQGRARRRTRQHVKDTETDRSTNFHKVHSDEFK